MKFLVPVIPAGYINTGMIADEAVTTDELSAAVVSSLSSADSALKSLPLYKKSYSVSGGTSIQIDLSGYMPIYFVNTNGGGGVDPLVLVQSSVGAPPWVSKIMGCAGGAFKSTINVDVYYVKLSDWDLTTL